MHLFTSAPAFLKDEAFAKVDSPAILHYVVTAVATLVASQLTLLAPLSFAQSSDAARPSSASAPVQLNAVYDGESVSNISGGAKRGTIYHGSAQAQANFDLAPLFGWQDTIFFLDGLLLHGGQPDDFVGDAQGVSNITAPSSARIEEAWLQHNFDGGRVSLLAGRYDLNSEFYRLHSAGLFLNSSFGIGPEFSQSGAAGPSVFPSTAVAARVQYKATPELVLRAALLAGKPFQATGENASTAGSDGLLLVWEAAYLERPGGPEPRRRRLRTGRFSGLPTYQDKYAVGLWHYTATFADVSATGRTGEAVQHSGFTGGYVLVDRLFTQSDASKPRAAGFLQLGIGDARVNRFGSYLGAGINISGLAPGRPNDELGFAFASARNGSHYLDQQAMLGVPVRRSENVFELTYLAEISKRIAVQPDLQYVIHPNTDTTTRNALVFLLRLEISLP